MCSNHLQLKDYIAKDMLAMIYAAGDQNAMMEESQEAAMRREELIRMYHTCNDALALIRDVSAKTGARTMLIHSLSMTLLSFHSAHTSATSSAT